MEHKRYMATFMAALLAILLALVAVERLSRTLPSPYKTKFDSVERRDRKFEVLILGSSHAYFGVNPAYFSMLALNLSNVSQDLSYDRRILEFAVARRGGVRYVVLPLSVFSLYSELDSGVEAWRKYNYRYFMGVKDLPAADWLNPANYSVFVASQRKVDLLKELLSSFTGRQPETEWTDLGWGTAYSRAADEGRLDASGRVAAARHQNYPDFSEASAESLERIASVCRDKGIKLLLFTPPAYSSYRRLIDDRRLALLHEYAHALEKQYGAVRYVDYFADPRFGVGDYFDADHLNHRGAQKISTLLDREIAAW